MLKTYNFTNFLISNGKVAQVHIDKYNIQVSMTYLTIDYNIKKVAGELNSKRILYIKLYSSYNT